jgi:anti-sigma B factor antagonist
MRPPELEISRTFDGPRLVLAVSGEVDMATVGGLRDALDRAAEESSDVWLDLSELEFMDSTGLTALVASHQAMADGLGRLTIVCPHGPVLRAIEVSGLHEVLRVCSAHRAASAD